MTDVNKEEHWKTENMINSAKIIGTALALVMLINAQSQTTVKDIDGNNYAVKQIGNEQWTTSNLNVATFRNGEIIPHATTSSEWLIAGKSKQPAWCYYKFDAKHEKEYGKLYNWYAVNDSRGLAPEGFKIPSMEDYETLIDPLGGEVDAGRSLKSTTGWDKMRKTWMWSYRNKLQENGTPYESGNGTNASGFNGQAGGRVNGNGESSTLHKYGHFWTSTKEEKTEWHEKTKHPLRICFFDLKHHEGGCGDGAAHRGRFMAEDGMSVRCVKIR
ncbi:MAG: fibrobacter succinogenes major paralogous domain-containing protein [Flavobacteriales bacterium]|nr:fibrobacter succinogenes major paralogous domain-containing protein [Flavobacteriales bacterium]